MRTGTADERCYMFTAFLILDPIRSEKSLETKCGILRSTTEQEAVATWPFRNTRLIAQH